MTIKMINQFIASDLVEPLTAVGTPDDVVLVVAVVVAVVRVLEVGGTGVVGLWLPVVEGVVEIPVGEVGGAPEVVELDVLDVVEDDAELGEELDVEFEDPELTELVGPDDVVAELMGIDDEGTDIVTDPDDGVDDDVDAGVEVGIEEEKHEAAWVPISGGIETKQGYGGK